MKHCINFILLVFLLIFGNNLFAQQNNSLYFINRVPQSTQLNPAIQPICNFYIGLPLNVEINGGNSAVSFNDVFLYDNKTDSLYYPMRNESTKNEFLNKLKPSSFVYSDNRIDLISLGFRIRESYFTFNISEKVDVYGFLPKDLIKLGMNFNQSSGSLANESFDLSRIGINANVYTEYGLSFSTAISPKFNFGVRAKFLKGVANVNTNASALSLKNIGVYSWETMSNFEINTSVPGMDVSTTNGEVDSISFDGLNNIKGYNDAKNKFINTKNNGFGIDLGITATLINNLTLSASLIDLGYINWKSNVTNFTQKGSFDFQGINLSLNDTADMVQALVDTLSNVYKVKTNTDPYTTLLTPKLFAGLYYEPAKGLGFGALARFQIIQKMLRPQFTFSTNLGIGRGLALNFSYTIVDGMYDNMGFGFVFKTGWLQWYFLTDRIPLTWDSNKAKNSIPYIPVYMKSANIHTGINLLFGCRHKIKLDKDKPLIEI